MTDFNLDSLTLDPVPLDAYHRLAVWAADNNRSDIIDMNLGHYYDLFDSFLMNRNDAEATLLPFWSKLYPSLYPRLTRLNRGLLTTARTARNNLTLEVHEPQRLMSGQWYIQKINMLRGSAHEYRRKQLGLLSAIDSTFGNIEPTPFDDSDIPAFSNPNIGGSNVNSQRRALEPAIQIIKLAMPMMLEFCGARGYTFRLRPPLAFAGPHIDALLANQAGITAPSLYYSKGAAAASDALQYIDSAIFGYSHDDYRQDFNEWIGLNGTAMIQTRTPETGDFVLTPSLMPSVLIERHHNKLPVIVERVQTGMIDDSVVRLIKVWPEQIESNRWPIDDLPRSEPIIAGHVMSLIAFAASIVSANLKVGSGSHKPYWVHTPLNSKTINAMLEIAPSRLAKFQEIL